jgi:hypothetical protein
MTGKLNPDRSNHTNRIVSYATMQDNKKTYNKKKVLMRGTGLEARDKCLNLLESRKNERGNKYQGSRILQDNPMVK